LFKRPTAIPVHTPPFPHLRAIERGYEAFADPALMLPAYLKEFMSHIFNYPSSAPETSILESML